MTGEHILIVEDEGLVAEDIKAHLEEFGWHVIGIMPTGEDAIELLKGTQADLVIMDIVLAGDADGITTAEKIRADYQIPVIYLTAYTDRDKIERARLTDPYGYLVKPFDERELKTTVAMALSKSVNDRAIREGKRWVTAILSSIEDGVITIDQAARIRDMNPKAEELLGQSYSESKNKLLVDLLKFNDTSTQSRFTDSIHRLLLLEKHQDSHLSGEINRKDNNEIHIDLNLSRIFYEEGDTEGVVVAFRDTSLQQEAKKKLEDYSIELERTVNERTAELNIAKEKAEAANLAKSQFLSNISHELITPLNPALGYAQILMLDNGLSTKQKAAASEIYRSCNILLNKITDLVELSRIDTDRLKVNIDLFNPIDIIENTIQFFNQKAIEKSLILKADYDANNTPNVAGDAKQITRILQLLVDNAIKFTNQGQVTVKLSTVAQPEDTFKLHFAVDDTGPGIKQDLINDIFNDFNQADNSSTRHHQGMGIGLTLSKRLVEYMNGKIGVKQLEPHGSSFWFELCLKKA